MLPETFNTTKEIFPFCDNKGLYDYYNRPGRPLLQDRNFLFFYTPLKNARENSEPDSLLKTEVTDQPKH